MESDQAIRVRILISRHTLNDRRRTYASGRDQPGVGQQGRDQQDERQDGPSTGAAGPPAH
jgi:hypothetical protein